MGHSQLCSAVVEAAPTVKRSHCPSICPLPIAMEVPHCSPLRLASKSSPRTDPRSASTATTNRPT
eukprot:9824935-Alexandrium_andersonii.AAC.1